MPVHKCQTCGSHLLFPVEHDKDFDLKILLDSWLAGLELEGRSFAHCRKLRQISRDYILPHFKTTDIRTLRAFHVRGYYHGLLRKKLSSKTVKHCLDALRNFLNRQRELENIESVPLFPKVLVKPVKQKAWLDEETQGRVLSFIPAVHRLIFRVLFETGVRPSEVCALRKRDLRDGSILIERAFDERGFVKSTKTGRSDERPLSACLYAELQDHARLSFPNVWLFTYLKLAPHSRHTLYKLWARASARAGLRVSLYNAVRHSKASQARRSLDAEMKERLRGVLGHTTAGTTLKHYALPATAEVKA